MEKFQFRFDTVPFCLRTVFHFIRFPFYRLPFYSRLVTVQIPCGICVLFTLTSGKLSTVIFRCTYNNRQWEIFNCGF